MLLQHNIDLNIVKPFGPASANGATDENTQTVINGRDGFMTDTQIARFCNGRSFIMDKIIVDMYYHLCWRQNNVPLPRLTDASVKLM